MRGKVPLDKPNWPLKISAVNVQGLASLDKSKLVRRMGRLSDLQIKAVKDALRELLDF